MAAYVIVDSKVHDPERIKAYGAKVGDTVKAHGGKPIINGSAIDVMEGDWTPSRLVVLEFADADRARLVQLAGVSGNPADPLGGRRRQFPHRRGGLKPTNLILSLSKDGVPHTRPSSFDKLRMRG